jgi:hypothetical protein
MAAKQKLGAAGQRLSGMSQLLQEKEQLLEEVRGRRGGGGNGGVLPMGKKKGERGRL